MTDLLGNQPTGDFLANSGTHAPATRGLRFQVTETTEVGALGWYRPTTGFSAFGRLLLYNGAGIVIRSADTVTDSGAVGWQWSPITTTSLSPGVTYTVAASTFTSGLTRIYPYAPRAARVAAPSPFLHDDIGTFANTTGPNLYPTTADNTIVVALSVLVGSGVDPGPGEGDPALTGDLGAWLSSDPDVQTHETDGLPWLTKQGVDSIGSIIGGLADAATSTGTLMGRTVELLARTATILARLPADILTAIQTAANSTLSWLGTGAKPAEAPTIPTQLDDALGRLLDLQIQLAAVGTTADLLWHRVQTADWLDAVPGGDWTLVDTLEWSGPIGWNQPADVYVLHITSYPPTWDQQDVDGHLWLPRALWWAPMSDTLPHERRWGDLEHQVLHALPMRCSGVLLNPRPNFAGTLEAWLRPTPP